MANNQQELQRLLNIIPLGRVNALHAEDIARLMGTQQSIMEDGIFSNIMSNFLVLDKRSYPVLKYVVKIGSFFNVEYSFKSVYNSSYNIISSSHTAILIISPPFLLIIT